MTRQKALTRLSAVQFAAWELHMYLDTHPGDKNAAERYRQYSAQYRKLRKEFEENYGALVQPSFGNEWLDDPWPWENTRRSDA